MPDAPRQSLSKIGAQPCTLAYRLAKAIPNPQTPQKHTTGYGTAFREARPKHPPEYKHESFPPHKEETHKTPAQPHQEGADPIIKRNCDLPACRRDPKHSKLNKMKKIEKYAAHVGT